ncbi:MAG: sigma-70 family RNA polymerase sigma factor [Bacteroidales bacterium]|nr:sigma-70 family RNA polymerase sigma factor [Bacteroidales bacterium]
MKEEKTFNEVVLQHRRLLFAVCHRYGRRGLEAEDLMQEVLMVLWRCREQLLAIASRPQQASWMWKVARSTCVDLLREAPPSYPVPEGFDTPEESITLQHELHELIALLPEPDRSIARLHLEGYDYKEIGERTGLTKSNVGVRLMRIKEKLKEQWNTI